MTNAFSAQFYWALKLPQTDFAMTLDTCPWALPERPSADEAALFAIAKDHKRMENAAKVQFSLLFGDRFEMNQ